MTKTLEVPTACGPIIIPAAAPHTACLRLGEAMDHADGFLRTAETLGHHLLLEATEERAYLKTVGAMAGVRIEDVELLILQVNQARAVLSEAMASA